MSTEKPYFYKKNKKEKSVFSFGISLNSEDLSSLDKWVNPKSNQKMKRNEKSLYH